MRRTNYSSPFLTTAAMVLGSCAWLSNVGLVWGSAIYSQTMPASPIGAFSSNDTATGQKIADNFLFNNPGAATIRSLRFIGGYVATNPPPITPPLNALPPDDFRVVFLTDSAGTPGLPLAGGDFHVGTAVWRAPTGGPLLNGDTTSLEYVLDLGSGITVSSSAVYWMSVVNNAGPNYGWTWARAAGAYDQRTGGTFGDITTGPWSVVSNGGMFFELSDNNVPEPSSFGIFLASAFLAWRIRLARRCRC